MGDNTFFHPQVRGEVDHLIARNPVIENACSIDLLTFLYRHPRTLLTNEQLATFVGYEKKLVAETVDRFIEAGLLERTQNAAHAARMYELRLNSPPAGGLKALLEIGSSTQGRRTILSVLMSRKSNLAQDHTQFRPKLRVIA